MSTKGREILDSLIFRFFKLHLVHIVWYVHKQYSIKENFSFGFNFRKHFTKIKSLWKTAQWYLPEPPKTMKLGKFAEQS